MVSPPSALSQLINCSSFFVPSIHSSIHITIIMFYSLADVNPEEDSSFHQANSRRKEELLLKIQTLQNDIFDHEKKLRPPPKGYQTIIEKLETEIQKVRGSIQSIKNARSEENLQKELESVLRQKKEMEEGQGKKRGKEDKVGGRSAGVRKILPSSPHKGYLV